MLRVALLCILIPVYAQELTPVQEASRLLVEAEQLCVSGNYAKALEHSLKAVELRKKVYGEGVEVADALNTCGSIYRLMGNLPKAEECSRCAYTRAYRPQKPCTRCYIQQPSCGLLCALHF